MRVLIFGSSGLLGQALMRAWTTDEVHGLSSGDADIRDEQQVREAVESVRPDWVVLSAAYTDVDGCEANQKLAFDVNTRGAVNVAHAAKDNAARLLFVSTDYVFDGRASTPYEIDSPRAPRSVYGKSKAEAEERLERIQPECLIVRTSWLFGAGGKCFPDTILKLAGAHPQLDVVNDQRGSPTLSDDLARAIEQLCHRNATGIVHVTNRGECTWFDLAVETVAGAGLSTEVRPTTSDKFVRPAPRPAYSVLSSRSLDALGITMPSWHDALGRYLKQRQA